MECGGNSAGGAGNNATSTNSARGLISAGQELATIGEQVKSLNLSSTQAVDETVRRVAMMLEERLGRYSQDEMLTIQEVSKLVGCSYGEARNRMLDGRIKSVKDGRWQRSRREWVEDYLSRSIVQKPDTSPPEFKSKRPKAKLVGEFKKGGLAYEFLRSRPD